MSKLTDEQAKNIREAKANGARTIDLEKEFGVSRFTINSIVRGKTHTGSQNKGGRPKGNLGFRNTNAKLDADAVFVIRYLYKNGMAKSGILSEMFGVSAANISRILQGSWWKHVPETIEEGPANLRPARRVELASAFQEMFGDAGEALLGIITDKGLKVEADTFQEGEDDEEAE
jgi:hypothetical protein